MLRQIERRLAGRSAAEVIRLGGKTLAHAARQLSPTAFAARRRDAAFDRRWGTDTTRSVNLGSLTVDAVRARHGVRYQASSGAALTQAVEAFGLSPAAWRFVDYGSGKGRIVLLAAAMGFDRPIGVEFAPELDAIARDNARRFIARSGARVAPEFVLGDAAAFVPPEGPLVVYLYNPFGGPVFAAVAARLAGLAARGVPLRLIYAEPAELDVLLASGALTVVRHAPDLALLRSAN